MPKQDQAPTSETIDHDGDTWRVLSKGVTRADGKTMLHLASTTRSRQQRNGSCPIQICDWVDLRDPITAFYDDRSKGPHSALAK